MIVDIQTRGSAQSRTDRLRSTFGLRRRQRGCGLPSAGPGGGLRLRPGHAGTLRLRATRQARQGRGPPILVAATIATIRIRSEALPRQRHPRDSPGFRLLRRARGRVLPLHVSHGRGPVARRRSRGCYVVRASPTCHDDQAIAEFIVAAGTTSCEGPAPRTPPLRAPLRPNSPLKQRSEVDFRGVKR